MEGSDMYNKNEILLTISEIKFESNLTENYKMIVFRESQNTQEKYVICQRAFTFDKQDMDLGMDSYYFEVEDQSNSGYDVCNKVIFCDNKVVFELKKEFVGDFEKIILNISDAKIDKGILDKYLQFIFKDIYKIN